jgi:glycosyltransferase involved in cell wall biosynthesis
MGDLRRTKMLVLAPIFWMRTRLAIRKSHRPDMANILYVYGSPSLDNMSAVSFARHLGYRVVFDIVEDDRLACDLSRSVWHRIQTRYACHMIDRMETVADGITVVSSPLARKFGEKTAGTLPIHLHPIAVDTDRLSDARRGFGDPITLFYGGGYGLQKGVANLIEAFDTLVNQGASLRLVLTGPDYEGNLPQLLRLCKNRTARECIEYRGYLDDEEYYNAVRQCDIPCIPRTDHGYAQAGFPFKLGEYLAASKPVVVSDGPDIRRFLKNRHNAIIVKPGSTDSLVSGIDYLLSHREEALVIGMKGRVVAQECFDYRSLGGRLYSFLCDVAGR